MPQKSSSPPLRGSSTLRRGAVPPPVMTWGQAAPVLILAGFFDLLRLFFQGFVFFGPAVLAVVCTAGTNSWLGVSITDASGKVTAALCVGAAATAGALAAGVAASVGILMAMIVGLIGWSLVGLWIMKRNPRLLRENEASLAWMIGSLAIAEVPFVGAVPAISFAMWRLHRRQIKDDKKKLAAYKAEEAERQRREQEHTAASTQMLARQEAELAVEQEAAQAIDMDEALRVGEERTLQSIPEKERLAA